MIKNLLATEKAVRMLDDNVITLIVDERVNKEQIKQEVEKVFKIEISKIRVLNTKKGKKVYVTLKKGDAKDIATELGMI